MQSYWSFISIALAASLACARGQTSYYRRTYYNPAVAAAPATHYYQHNHGVMGPMAAAYGSSGGFDLASEESKQRDAAPQRYAKKSSYLPYGSEEDDLSSERYSASGEYSNEAHSYGSRETDSREYTIGTKIRVQHPITITKKPAHSKANKYVSSNAYKSARGGGGGGGGGGSYSNADLSSIESHNARPSHSAKKHTSHNKYTELFDVDPIHVVAPPKHLGPSALASSGSYSVYEPEEHDYDIAASPSTRSRAQLLERFKGVASKKQIEKYLEDQQKLLDEALKLQLLSNPKFKKLFKNKAHEYFEDQQYEHELPPEPFRTHAHFDDNIHPKSNRPRRRPRTGEPPRSPKLIKGGLATKPRRFRSALVINV